jgi:tetratricopeptide (TPR) repeat protein
MMAQIQQIIEKAKANPKDFNAQIQAAQVFAEIDRGKEAVEYLEKAYEASSGDFAKLDPGAFDFAARYYFELKQYPQAEEWYSRAIKVAPQNAGNYVMLAKTFAERQPPQPDRAIDNLQQALRIAPRDAHALGHLVEAYALKKDARSAEEALNRLKETNPASDRVSKLQTLVADLKAGKPISIPKE